MRFKTQRLILQPILESELNTLHQILTDSYVRQYLCDDNILTLEQTEAMLQQSLKHFEDDRFGLWLIRRNDQSEAIGIVGLWYFFEEEQPQLMYALLPEALKQGYATEAATRIIEYCFNELGYKYVVASCDRPNLESQKVAARLGMRAIEERIIHGNTILFFRIDRA